MSSGRPGSREHGFCRQHVHHLARRQDAGHGGGRAAAVRADRRTGHGRAIQFRWTLPGGFAAHTKLDRRTGELHAIAYFWAWDHVQHVVVDPTGTVTRTTDIPVPDGPMMHDFALTGKYVVLFDLPVTFSLNAVTQGKELPYVWNSEPSGPGRAAAPGRQHSTVQWIGIDPCWVFHTLNAYDMDDGKVLVDLCQYQAGFDVSTLWSAHGPVTLDRWTIDPAAGTIRQQRLDDRGQEFPRVDDRIISKPNRYGYSAVIGEITRAITVAGDFSDDAFSNAILKHDWPRARPRCTSSAGTPRSARRCSPVRAGRRRGRRVRDDVRAQSGPRRRRPGHPGRPGLHRRAGGPGAPARPDPARLPRQLDAGR